MRLLIVEDEARLADTLPAARRAGCCTGRATPPTCAMTA